MKIVRDSYVVVSTMTDKPIAYYKTFEEAAKNSKPGMYVRHAYKYHKLA